MQQWILLDNGLFNKFIHFSEVRVTGDTESIDTAWTNIFTNLSVPNMLHDGV